MPETDAPQPPRSNRATLFFLTLVFLVMGGIGLFIGGRTALEDWRYQRHAIKTRAVTTGKTLRLATTEADTAYEVSYRFALPDGRPYERTEIVPVHAWESVERGSVLAAEYLPQEPAMARVVLDRPDRRRTMVFGLTIGALSFVIGLFLFKSGLRRSAVDADSTSENTVVVAAESPVHSSYWTLAYGSAKFWLGAMVLIVAVPMVVTIAFLFYNDWMFARSASTTNGMVLTKEIERSGRQNRRSTEYKLTYRFTVGGKTLEGRDELSQQGWERLTERKPVVVRYLPQKPSSSRLAGPHPWLGQTFLGLIGLVFLSIGTTFFLGAVRHARREWRLRQQGVSTHGTVTELRERNVKINGVQQWRLHFEFRDYQGRVHRNTIDIPADEAEQWKVGDSGKVLYDSKQPIEAVWLGREA